MMVSTTAIHGGNALPVDVTSAPETSPNPLQSLASTRFSSCPTQHGLGRSNDENLLQAIVSSISYHLEKLSLSDEPVLESPTATIYHPVYTATVPAGTDSTPNKNPARPSLRNIKPKLLGRLANGLKAGLQKSIRKRVNTKKRKAPIPPLPVSPCSPVERQESLIGQIVDVIGGLPVSNALEATPCGRYTRFHELFTFDVRGTPAQQVNNPTFLQPVSTDAYSNSTVTTLGDEVANDTMDEDEQQLPSARPASPIPMDLEGTEVSSDASLDAESPRAPFGESSERDTRASVPELTDSIMSDGEQTLSNSEAAHSMEPTDTVMIDAASPTVFDREMNMDGVEDRKSPKPLERATMGFIRSTRDSPASGAGSQSQILGTNPGQDSAPVTSASIASSELPPPPVQILPPSRFYTPTEASSVAEGDRNLEPVPTQGQVVFIKSTQTGPASSPAVISASTVAVQVSVPSTPAMTSTAGPSTTTPTSPLRTQTRAQDQVPNAHASRVHQVLDRLRVSKPASKSTQRSINDEASEEAEAAAYLAKIASRRDHPTPQNKPSPPPPSLHPKQTRGSASRSLMENLMAGFGRSTMPKSSQKQLTAATQPSSVASNSLNTSQTVQPAHRASLPVVSGLKPAPKLALPSSVVGNGRQAAASPSGRAPSTISPTGKVLSTSSTPLPVPAGLQSGPQITSRSSVVRTGRQAAASPSGRAPSTLSATDNVNGPQGSVPTQAGPHGPRNKTSEAAMDGVESGRRAIKGSRRVARAMAKTKVTWKTVQQMARQTQAALETAQRTAAASTSATSVKSDEEELRRSQQWHAAQPPPPPEAMPYINTDQQESDSDEEEYDGDPDDFDALLAWTLSRGA